VEHFFTSLHRRSIVMGEGRIDMEDRSAGGEDADAGGRLVL